MTSCRETDDPIKMLFGLCTQVGPKNHELGWGPDPQGKGAILGIVRPHWKCTATARASTTAAYQLHNTHINYKIYMYTVSQKRH